MRLLTVGSGTSMVQLGRAPAQPAGGFLQLQQRDRKTLHPEWTEFGSALAGAGIAVSGDPLRQLTTDQLFQVYRRVPDVRSAVDSITRRVATNDWTLRPVEGAIPPEDEAQRKEALAVCRDAARWFRAPMTGKTWQQWLTMVCQDLLIYDATAWEKVKGGGRRGSWRS